MPGTQNIASRVTLERVVAAQHAPLLKRWLYLPHVAKWWHNPGVRLQCLHTIAVDQHAIIAVDATPVGYLCWQKPTRSDLDAVGLFNVPDVNIDIDIFIGETSFLGRGVGPAALSLLLKRLQDLTDAPLASLCTSIDNDSAISAFEKAGFSRSLQFDDPEYGRCWAMTKPLRR